MKNLSLAMASVLVCALSSMTISAQNHPHNHKGHKNHKVVKTERTVKTRNGIGKVTVTKKSTVQAFPRTKVTVVKQRRVRVVPALPVGYTTAVFGGKTFYHHGGRYYNYVGNNYTVIGTPLGLRVRLLPVGHRRIFIGSVPHYYYAGAYYKQIGDEYEAVEPAVGTIVPELPEDDVEEIMIDGQTFYEFDNTLYKSVVTKEGVQYEVVGKLAD